MSVYDLSERLEAWIEAGSEALYQATRGWAYIKSVRQGCTDNFSALLIRVSEPEPASALVSMLL